MHPTSALGGDCVAVEPFGQFVVRTDAFIRALSASAWVPRPFQGWGTESTADTVRPLPFVVTNKFGSPPLERAGHPAASTIGNADV